MLKAKEVDRNTTSTYGPIEEGYTHVARASPFFLLKGVTIRTYGLLPETW